MLRDEFFSSGIVECALNPSVHSTHSEALRLVEMWHRLMVLRFPILNDHVRFGPVAVNRQVRSSSGPSGVATQPVESMLA